MTSAEDSPRPSDALLQRYLILVRAAIAGPSQHIFGPRQFQNGKREPHFSSCEAVLRIVSLREAGSFKLVAR